MQAVQGTCTIDVLASLLTKPGPKVPSQSTLTKWLTCRSFWLQPTCV